MSHKEVVTRVWMQDGQTWVQEATYYYVRDQNHQGEEGYLLAKVEYHEPRVL